MAQAFVGSDFVSCDPWREALQTSRPLRIHCAVELELRQSGFVGCILVFSMTFSQFSLLCVCVVAFPLFFYFILNVGQLWYRFKTHTGHGGFLLVSYSTAWYGNSMQSQSLTCWPTLWQEVSLSKHKNSKYSENNSRHMYIIAILKYAINPRLNSTNICIHSYPLCACALKVNRRMTLQPSDRFRFTSWQPCISIISISFKWKKMLQWQMCSTLAHSMKK